MNVIGHDYEFVELEDPTLAISMKCVEEESGSTFGAEERSSFPSHGCNEKCAIRERVHATAA
jgi:hypothetical protein